MHFLWSVDNWLQVSVEKLEFTLEKIFLLTLLTFLGGFLIPIIFSNLNCNFSIVLDLRNLQEQVKKSILFQKLVRPFTVWINCSIYFKNLANSRTSASNFKSFSWSVEHFLFTVGQNNFGNKIQFTLHLNYPNLNILIIANILSKKLIIFQNSKGQ